MDWEVLLEKYVQGSLNNDEQKTFDLLLKENGEFRKEVAFQKNLIRVTEEEDDDTFRNLLSEFEAESVEQKSKRKGIPSRWLVAASIALIISVGYFAFFEKGVSTKALFIENFEPYRNVVNPIVRGEADRNLKNKAFTYYQKGDYENANMLFAELYEKGREPYYLFYRANALIQLNRGREAIPLLNEHLISNDSLADKSYWYLAMAYLQISDKGNAIKMLHKVVDVGTFNVERAKQLLKELE